MAKRTGLYENLTMLLNDVQQQDKLKAEFETHPKEVMKRYGIDVPDELNIKTVNDTYDTRYIVIPYQVTLHPKISDEELEARLGRRGTKPR